VSGTRDVLRDTARSEDQKCAAKLTPADPHFLGGSSISNGKAMNPWISIWTEPRKTIDSIVDENPKKHLWLLAWIYGFLSFMNASQSFVLGNTVQFFGIILLSILIAPLWGMLVFQVWSYVVHLIGKLLKGKGSFPYVRAAFAWSCVPLTVNIFLWILLLLVFGKSLFQTAEPTTGPVVLLTLVLIAKVIVMIWSLVIYINALAEVQRFSIGRAILNILLAWIAVAVVAFLLWLVLASFLNQSISPSQAVLNLTLRMQI
jgi:Yip1 domain